MYSQRCDSWNGVVWAANETIPCINNFRDAPCKELKTRTKKLKSKIIKHSPLQVYQGKNACLYGVTIREIE